MINVVDKKIYYNYVYLDPRIPKPKNVLSISSKPILEDIELEDIELGMIVNLLA